MGVPSYGAAPLAKTFLAVRGLQTLSFIIIVGITAHAVSNIVYANQVVPREIVGTLTVTSIATLYTLISIPFFYAPARLGLLVMAAVDFLLLIAFVVVAVVLGKPLSYADCSASSLVLNQPTAAWVQSVSNKVHGYGSFLRWSISSESTCYQSKAVWGICIGLCILYTCSILILPTLFFKQRRLPNHGGKGWA